MTQQTVKNMKLLVLEMKKHLSGKSQSYKTLKTLSHSYETLLDQISINKEEYGEHQLTSDIVKQLEEVAFINNKLSSESIPELIGMRCYQDVNHLTTTTTRLNNITQKLNQMLTSLYKEYNKKVWFVSTDFEKAYQLMLKTVGNEDIFYQTNYFRNKTIVTNTTNYFTTEYNSSYRGSRVDYVYIDSDMSIEQIEMCKKYVKEESSFELFNI